MVLCLFWATPRWADSPEGLTPGTKSGHSNFGWSKWLSDFDMKWTFVPNIMMHRVIDIISIGVGSVRGWQHACNYPTVSGSVSISEQITFGLIGAGYYVGAGAVAHQIKVHRCHPIAQLFPLLWQFSIVFKELFRLEAELRSSQSMKSTATVKHLVWIGAEHAGNPGFTIVKRARICNICHGMHCE